jgi:hypothetical protein
MKHKGIRDAMQGTKASPIHPFLPGIRSETIGYTGQLFTMTKI